VAVIALSTVGASASAISRGLSGLEPAGFSTCSARSATLPSQAGALSEAVGTLTNERNWTEAHRGAARIMTKSRNGAGRCPMHYRDWPMRFTRS